ncbi:TetR/AcrR family transcriptional regulator [Thiothrix sp.]|uniref:TetR/AcrR family transcriptional regulator n=1 Tax=Thiothrix sp. TaxID=1032 RepID=UPI00257DC638|nr:TetR/AcrR family transcriptional regulator [Thiothrix sp.]
MKTSTDTRQRLLDSARELLYSRSYGNVGVKEICDMAGVQKGSFYHFFPSKQELTLAVLDEFFIISKQEIFSRSFRPEWSGMQQLKALLENIYVFQKSTKEQIGKTLGCPYGNMSSEMSTQDEIIRQRLNGLLQQMEMSLKTALDQALHEGEIAPCNTAATAAAMFAFIEGLMLLAKTRNDPELIREIGAAMLTIRIGEQAAT